jgi:PAS domain S-box-containing protein
VERVLGYKAEEFYARGAELWFGRISSGERPRVKEAFQRFMNGEGTFDMEYQVQRKEGAWIWVHDRALRTHQENGRRFADGIFSDITARKLAELARDESERRYRSLFERNLAGVFRTETSGKVLDCNPAMLKMFGYSSMTALLERPSSDVFYDQSEARAAFDRLFREGSLNNFEIRLQHANGSPFWALENVCLVYDEQGCPVFIEGTVIDISDRKKMEDELRQKQQAVERQSEVLCTLVEGAPASVIMLDREMRVIYASDRLCKEYGMQREAILGKSLYEVFPHFPERWKDAHRRALHGEILGADQDCWVGPDEKERWLRWEVRPWGDSGETTGGIIIFTEDVTERRLLESQLLQAQKMEAVGQLAAGVAHDFSNLLTVILTYAQLIQDAPGNAQQVTDHAGKILAASRKATQVTNRLLEFSRKRPQQLEILDLNAVVTEFCRMLPPFSSEGIELITAPKAANPFVYADQGQIEQVIMNLVVNARDAMPCGGRLTLATSNRRLGSDFSAQQGESVAADDYVMLTISDTGCGMDDATQARIFEPFFTTKGVGKGTGLGLAVVYAIVKQSSGLIWMRSVTGRGTTFELYFPVASGPACDPAIPSGAVAKLSQKK